MVERTGVPAAIPIGSPRSVSGMQFCKRPYAPYVRNRGRLTRGILPCLPHTMKSLRGNHKAAFCLSRVVPRSEGLTTLEKGTMDHGGRPLPSVLTDPAGWAEALGSSPPPRQKGCGRLWLEMLTRRRLSRMGRSAKSVT
jgi:hypothetical protein